MLAFWFAFDDKNFPESTLLCTRDIAVSCSTDLSLKNMSLFIKI
jgi:hypothetical protein